MFHSNRKARLNLHDCSGLPTARSIEESGEDALTPLEIAMAVGAAARADRRPLVCVSSIGSAATDGTVHGTMRVLDSTRIVFRLDVTHRPGRNAMMFRAAPGLNAFLQALIAELEKSRTEALADGDLALVS